MANRSGKNQHTGWSAREEARLLALRHIHGRDFIKIAEALPGRTAIACKVRYHQIIDREEAEPAPAPKPIDQASPVPPSPRTVSTAILLADAELRRRIEIQGLTGGLLGDPLPGRSALDRRAQ